MNKKERNDSSSLKWKEIFAETPIFCRVETCIHICIDSDSCQCVCVNACSSLRKDMLCQAAIKLNIS